MIRFYDPRDPYGFFSNFSRHQVTIYDRTWRTSEAAFQAMKFHPHRPDLVEVVHQAETPGKSARLGRDPSHPLRTDWNSHPDTDLKLRVPMVTQPTDTVNRPGVLAEPLFARTKDIFMFEVVLAKFQQNRDLREALLATKDESIIEDARDDPYWGWGASFVGENKLGRILMAVRTEIAGAQAQSTL
jgi:predicted NAD-dependent protein-ADP-ribosyltransferase YbiA (DUF1768 family)